jgi:hypothetical protein
VKTSVTLVGALALAACAAVSRTEFQSSWQDASYSGGPFDRVAVLANFETESDSRQFEKQVGDALRARGVDAIEGRAFLEDGKLYSQDEMEARLRNVDADGILIFKLIAVDKDRRYEPPAVYLQGIPRGVIYGDPFYWYYYPHYSYYWYWRAGFAVTRAPGYWREHRYVVVESSLYSNRTNELVWTAKTRTLDDTEFSRLADSIARAVTRRLEDADLIGARTG